MTAIDDALAEAQSKIGTETGISSWVTIDQPMIDAFAETTGDHQWIHVDPERASRETPYKSTIAHGFLTLSLGAKFNIEVTNYLPGQIMGINYGFEKVRFLSPVITGKRVRGRFVLQDMKKRSETELLRTSVLTVEIEGQETPALVAHWLGLAVFGAE